MKKIIFCCCFVVIGHSVYPLEKNQQPLVCSFVNLIMVWKTNQTIFKGVVILGYEGKMGRGGVGCFVCLFPPPNCGFDAHFSVCFFFH